MDESGQRNSTEEIIDISEHLPWYRRIVEAIITMSLWALWVYFIVPIITLGLWIIGIKWFGDNIANTDLQKELLAIINGSAIVILSILAVNTLWIWHNCNRYKKYGERRSPTPNCTTKQISKFYQLPTEQVEQCLEYTRIGISVKDNNVVLEWSCNTCSSKEVALKKRGEKCCDKGVCFYELPQNDNGNPPMDNIAN